MALEATAVNEGTRVEKNQFQTGNSTNASSLTTGDVFSRKKKIFSLGLQQKYEAGYEPSSDSDFAFA